MSHEGPSIEVIGSAEYSLKPIEYRVMVKFETKSGFSDLGKSKRSPNAVREKFMNEIVERVLSKGFPEKDIIYGGRSTYQVWRKKSANELREADQLIFRSADASVIMRIPLWLEDVKSGQLSVTFQSLPTIFEEQSGPEVGASAKALENARAKAEAIASVEKVKLGALLTTQDMRLVERGGDNQQWLVAGGSSGDDLAERKLGEEVETRMISFRAKFSVTTG